MLLARAWGWAVSFLPCFTWSWFDFLAASSFITYSL
jgi:hypothetical protein